MDDVRHIAVEARIDAKYAHERLDKVEADLLKEHEAKHDIYKIIHNHAGVITGMEGAVNRLTDSVQSWATRTDINTTTLAEGKTTLKTAIIAFRIGITIISVLGTGFASFIIFVGGRIMSWW